MKNSDFRNSERAAEQIRKRFPGRKRFRNRELSWLDFNERVLEEARDPDVPLLERLRFLAIFASNLDEFFMVRVAFVRRQIEAGITGPGKDGYRPGEIIREIVRRVNRAHEMIGDCYRTMILPGLEREGIVLVTDLNASADQKESARRYFESTVRPLLDPAVLDSGRAFPDIENGALYVLVRLREKKRKKISTMLLRIPTGALGRFAALPPRGGERCYMLMDDLVRLFLADLFPGQTLAGSYEIRMMRDSDLSLDEVGSTDLLKSIVDGLARRKRGPATRLLVDPETPPALLRLLRRGFKLTGRHIFIGARNHAFSDFMQFPTVVNRSDLLYEPMPPLPIPGLGGGDSLFKKIREGDILLQHPFQDFSYVVRFFEEAASDADVTAISTTLYRVATDSRIARALMTAAENRKEVTVLVELKARFDEERNIGWAKALGKAGARVLYGVRGLKTHCKVALVTRAENGEARDYSHLSTGNYNDRTARVYSDLGLFTTRKSLTADVKALFRRITGDGRVGDYNHLLVAPEFMRREFTMRVRREAMNARGGRVSGITAKMNSLVDEEIIDELYAASQSGVPIFLIVRGICSLRPGIRGLSERIEVCSIIDRFLEHARVYRFENGGDPELFLSSADWMPRNLNSRIETAFPILDGTIRRRVEKILQLQLADTMKARLLRSDGTSERRKGKGDVRAQFLQYETARRLAEGNTGNDD